MKRTTPRYREVDASKPIWIWPVIAFVTVLVWYGFVEQIVLGRPFGDNAGPDQVVWLSWLLGGIALPVFFVVARLFVIVDSGEVTLRWFPLWTRRVPLTDIEACEARDYHPIREYGGWGIRYGGPERGWAYTMSGRRGVFLRCRSGKHVLVGSKSPERLAAAINAARAS
jgi:hypothetical protein